MKICHAAVCQVKRDCFCFGVRTGVVAAEGQTIDRAWSPSCWHAGADGFGGTVADDLYTGKRKT